MPAHFENDEKCDGIKIGAIACTRWRNNWKTVRNLMIKKLISVSVSYDLNSLHTIYDSTVHTNN